MPHSQFERLISLIGIEEFNRLKNKKVLIIGIGGVGGYTVESLARSGIEKIILVDHDSIDITNFNRQIIALHSNLGKSKVEKMKERILDINKECKVEIHSLFLDDSNYDDILTEDIDFIIDTCDSIKTKKMLIKETIKKDIPIISCMGTANKVDPTKLEITDIRKTINDPIARILRKFVKELNTTKKITVLSSKEVPLKNRNILGTNAFVPPIAGLLIANYVINELKK